MASKRAAAVILCAAVLAWGPAAPAYAQDQDSSASANMQSEMEDFVQYYRSKQDKSAPQEDAQLTPEDQLKNDLLPVTGANVSPAGPSAGPKAAAAKSSAPAVVKKDTSDSRAVRTGVSAEQHAVWLGTPLYKGTGNVADQYKAGDTSTAHVLTPTVYRAQTYKSGT